MGILIKVKTNPARMANRNTPKSTTENVSWTKTFKARPCMLAELALPLVASAGNKFDGFKSCPKRVAASPMAIRKVLLIICAPFITNPPRVKLKFIRRAAIRNLAISVRTLYLATSKMVAKAITIRAIIKNMLAKSRIIFQL